MPPRPFPSKFSSLLISSILYLDHSLRFSPYFHPIYASITFIFLTFVAYIILFIYISPSVVYKGNLFFDFTAERPIAQINLLSSQNQWNYHHVTRADKSNSRYLQSSQVYEISCSFSLSKSPTNLNLLKFMANLSTIDSTGSVIATSIRPVILPYQSFITLTSDAIIKWPFYVFGLSRESVVIPVLFMANYQEPPRHMSPTSSVVMILSHGADVEAAAISIIPVVSGIG